MAITKKVIIIIFCFVAISTGAWAVYSVFNSPLFSLQVLEVAELPPDAPMDSRAITDLAALPLGAVSLFKVDLKMIEQRMLENSWIQQVRLEKKFPQTLSMSVEFRQPVAFFQTGSGDVSYVDIDGKIFGRLRLNSYTDLPFISGIVVDDKEKIKTALEILHGLEKNLDKMSRISNVVWDGQLGFRALVIYPFYGAKGKSSDQVLFGRAFVELGPENFVFKDAQFKKITAVISYLSTHRISAQRIWADAEKKIVVKTARSS
ncbi:MAG: FtsQ-type POTRA domain-containing protein [Bdellovibrionota bacterium]